MSGGRSLPIWKEDFPIAWTDDHFITRREFTKSLVVVSCAAFAANATLVTINARRRAPEPAGAAPRLLLPGAGAMPERSARVFQYQGRACLLVRLGAERFAAFEQKCTHLGCPVLYRPERQVLECPCHAGVFDAATGNVLAGPPPRPLPTVALETTKGGELWATAIKG